MEVSHQTGAVFKAIVNKENEAQIVHTHTITHQQQDISEIAAQQQQFGQFVRLPHEK
jgi:hypothetical protein